MSKPDRSKIGLVDALQEARRDEKTYLRFLSELLQEQREAKWIEAGVNHSLWRRNMALIRTRHIVNKDDRTPWPIENYAWSIQEGVRPIWGDNPPQVQIVPLREGADFSRGAYVLRMAWEWAYQVGHFMDAWEGLFDYLPSIGTVGLKVTWDNVRQNPIFSPVDPRAIYADPSARLHHRYARVLTLVHRVDIGEVREALPEIADKIGEARAETDVMEESAEQLRRDTGTLGSRVRGTREIERKVEVVEMWFNEDLLPLERDILNKADEEGREAERLDEADLAGESEVPSPISESEDKFLVVTFIPEAGVVYEERVVTGRQVFTGQHWRNVDSLYGISDATVIAGLQIAMDQLAIRGHSHRLAMFAPSLIVPKDSRVTRRQLSGRPAPLLEPMDRTVAEGIRYLEVPGPSREAVEFFLTRPQIMRRILGTDEIRPELFEREQTASGLALLVSALENRLRQKIRNLRPMVHDCVETTLRMILSYSPQGFSFRSEDGSSVEITAGQLQSINLKDYAIITSLDRPGPLSKQARIASIERAIALGVLDPSNSMPLVVREMLMDEIELPHRDEIKAEFRRLEAEKEAAKQSILQASAASPVKQPISPA